MSYKNWYDLTVIIVFVILLSFDYSLSLLLKITEYRGDITIFNIPYINGTEE